MNSLDIDLLEGEVIHRNDFDAEPTALDCSQGELAQPSDSATVALEMVSEAAAAIRCLEEQSAEAVRRARELASSIVKQLESTEARAERAEVAQQQSEVEVQELSAALARTEADLDIARRQLADKDERFATVEERVRLTKTEATEAQQRAMEASAAIEKIVGAIRSQLPEPRRFVRTSLNLPGVATTLASPMVAPQPSTLPPNGGDGSSCVTSTTAAKGPVSIQWKKCPSAIYGFGSRGRGIRRCVVLIPLAGDTPPSSSSALGERSSPAPALGRPCENRGRPDRCEARPRRARGDNCETVDLHGDARRLDDLVDGGEKRGARVRAGFVFPSAPGSPCSDADSRARLRTRARLGRSSLCRPAAAWRRAEARRHRRSLPLSGAAMQSEAGEPGRPVRGGLGVVVDDRAGACGILFRHTGQAPPRIRSRGGQATPSASRARAEGATCRARVGIYITAGIIARETARGRGNWRGPEQLCH